MIPTFLLNKVYAPGSLKNIEGGVRFEILNRLMNIEQVAVRRVAIDGEEAPLDRVRLELSTTDGKPSRVVEAGQLFPLPLGAGATLLVFGRLLPTGAHQIEIGIEAPPFGQMQFTVEDHIAEDAPVSGQGPEAVTAPEEEPGNADGAGREEETPAQAERIGALYDAGVRLLTSSVDTYLDAQKRLLNLAIEQVDGERIVGERNAEIVKGVVTELTSSFEEVARKSVENFAEAGKLILDAATRPPKERRRR